MVIVLALLFGLAVGSFLKTVILPAGGKAPLGVRYPLIEVGTGLLFAALAWRLDRLELLSALPAYCWFASVGIALVLIDLQQRKLPNAIVLPSYPVLGGLLALSAAWHHDWAPLVRAGLGAVALFASFFVLALLVPGGMGWGDIKLSGLVGGATAYLSWSTLVEGAFCAFLLGAVAGVVMLAAKRGGHRKALPFGPFLIVGGVLAIFTAGPVTEAWNRLTE
jgi:leader peptidase (prepilin peptidase)/N-methyltransferase